MEIVFKGVLTGCILSVMIGPVFFVLLETSIRRGIRAALAFDLGVLLNDIVYIFIAYLFYNQVSELSQGDNNALIRIAGGSLFLSYGILNFFKKVKGHEESNNKEVSNKTMDYVLLICKGFLLNLANPFVVFYWFGVITIGVEMGEDVDGDKSMLIFLTTILVSFFSVDILKIFGAKKLKPWVTAHRLVLLNRFIGLVFFASGLYLLIDGISKYF